MVAVMFAIAGVGLVKVLHAPTAATPDCLTVPAASTAPVTFDAKRLDAQLERKARRFFADPTHLWVDVPKRTVHLTTICKGYEEHFIHYLAKKGAPETKVLSFVKLYAPSETRAKIEIDLSIEYIPYDWRLSDQHSAWAGERSR
jgi:hypothetical protein